MKFLSIIAAIVLAAIAYGICSLIGLPSVVGIVAAVLVLLTYFPANTMFTSRKTRV